MSGHAPAKGAEPVSAPAQGAKPVLNALLAWGYMRASTKGVGCRAHALLAWGQMRPYLGLNARPTKCALPTGPMAPSHQD